MAMKIRLARSGAKKRPYYSIVAADSRMARDGRFIEKLGVYNPLLPKESEDRVKLDIERARAWIEKGAKPTDRVSRFLEAAGVIEAPTRANLKKGEPGKKAQERAEAQKVKAEKAKAAAEAPAEAPAESPAESPVEAAADAPAETAAETAAETPAAEEAAE